MLKNRLVACLLLRDGWVVQSVRFKRYLPIGTPEIAVEYLVRWDIDEIILIDMTATLKGKGPNLEMVSRLARRCLIPLTVGGGVRCLEDIRALIYVGAEKVSINSAILKNRALIQEGSQVLGTQSIVASIDVKVDESGSYQVYGASGTWATGLHPVEWAQEVERLGAGEIFLNSIDRDGTKQGYDTQLIRLVVESVHIPVIACGGVGRMGHFSEGILKGKASAVAAANIFHFTEQSVVHAKENLSNAGIAVRQ